MSDLIARAEAWLSRLRPCDTGANGPMFTRLLIEELKKREYVGSQSARPEAEAFQAACWRQAIVLNMIRDNADGILLIEQMAREPQPSGSK